MMCEVKALKFHKLSTQVAKFNNQRPQKTQEESWSLLYLRQHFFNFIQRRKSLFHFSLRGKSHLKGREGRRRAGSLVLEPSSP